MDLAEGSSGIEIRIRVNRTEPLNGTAAVDEPARRLEFNGWMGMIGAIAELLGSADEDVKEAG